MSKFLKRIEPLVSKYESAVVLGRDFVNIPDLLGGFNTVFVFDTQRTEFKGKNLVPRIGFSDTKSLPNFSLLVIDEPCLWEIGNFTPIASNNRAGIVLVHGEPIGKKILKHLWNYNYECVGNHKNLNFWKKAS